MTPFTAVALSATIMTVTNAKTLIIGGGPAGVHMGYRLQERDQSSVIWEMTDQLGGKAGNQYEKDGTTMNIGVNFIPRAYREVFKVVDELGMKNFDEMKIWDSPNVVDPVVACFFAMGFDESKCQDLTIYPKETQAAFASPMPLIPNWMAGRGLLLMKEEDYFNTFVVETTKKGFDWTSPNLDIGGLIGLVMQRLIGYEIPTYRQYLDKYTDGAFSNSTNTALDFNKYSLFKKSDEVKQALNQKALEFMQEKKFYFFRMFAEQFLTGLGYGNLEDTPLYYLGMMLNPQYLDYFMVTLSGKTDQANFIGGLYILKGGFPSVLDNMVTKGNLDVRFNREVTKVVHVEETDSSFFEVYYTEHDIKSSKGEKKTKRDKGKKNIGGGKSIKKGKKSGKKVTLKKSGKKGSIKMERFDRVISGMSSQNFVSIYNKGKEIQQPFLCREACTFVSTVAEVAPSTVMVGAFDGKLPLFEKGSNYLEDPSVVATVVLDPLRVKGIPLDNDDGSRRIQMYYQYPYKPVSKSKAQALNKQDLDTLFDARYASALDVKEVYSTVVVENYSATSKDLSTCDPWDVHELQGKNGLYFIGGTVNFDNLELLIRYNNYMLDTHF